MGLITCGRLIAVTGMVTLGAPPMVPGADTVLTRVAT